VGTRYNYSMETVILSPTIANITFLSQELQKGEVIAIPTETVYGLAAIATDNQAIKTIYHIKKRPSHKPLILLYPSLKTMEKDVFINEAVLQLAKHFWPGPLTLILPQKPDSSISPLASASSHTLAVRIPSSPLILALLEATKTPLTAPSANLSGETNPLSATEVMGSFEGHIPWILDGGPAEDGVPSTLLDMTRSEPRLLRQGKIDQHTLEECLHRSIASLL
jgi:L-threonylcarbamoyladenylate synthase